MLIPAMIRAALSRLSIPVLAAALLLSACGSSRPDPQEVISRSVRATQAMRSVQFNLSGQVHFWSLQLSVDGAVTASGATAEGGKSVFAAVGFDGELGQGDMKAPASAEADLSLLPSGELAVRVRALDGLPFDIIFPSAQRDAMLDRWVRLVAGSTGTVVTPEPRLLDAQAESIAVTEDLGETTIRGVKVQHYRVAIDKQKFAAYLARAGAERGETASFAWFENLAADGEIWIDAETALVHRIRWSVVDPKGNNFSFNVTVDLTEHGTAAPPEAPTNLIDLDALPTAPSLPAAPDA